MRVLSPALLIGGCACVRVCGSAEVRDSEGKGGGSIERPQLLSCWVGFTGHVVGHMAYGLSGVSFRLPGAHALLCISPSSHLCVYHLLCLRVSNTLFMRLYTTQKASQLLHTRYHDLCFLNSNRPAGH